jgi:GTP-binding protein HflX
LIQKSEESDKVILLHLHLRDSSEVTDLREFRELALSAGTEVVAVMTSNRVRPDATFCIGRGKVEELRLQVVEKNVDVVLFDCSLSPAQERNLERALNCRVVDRTGLILDIFAQRARSYEGKLQVELAQLQHLSTRLIRGWTHLERHKGGIGLRGPGETQLEVDRRLIKGRIKHIKAALEKVQSQRDQSRSARQKASLPMVSLVGYTNAGKSTLFNALTGSEVYVANLLFATLDPTLRCIDIPPVGKVVFADTVGFVRHLPHDLVKAFRATLEETRAADLLLHVIDAQDDNWQAQRSQVWEVLGEIGALGVPRIEVYNKIDVLSDSHPHFERNTEGLIADVWLSAEKRIGLELLTQAITERLGQLFVEGVLSLNVEQGRIRALLYESGAVLREEEALEGGWILWIRFPKQRWLNVCRENPGLECVLKN